jgi:hypothetical protein
MTEEPSDVSMAWIDGPDGLPILLLAGHMDRVTALRTLDSSVNRNCRQGASDDGQG